MAQLVVRNIEDDVKERLRERAARHGHSMEEEARIILREAVGAQQESQAGFGTRLAEIFRGHGMDFTIPDLDDDDFEPPSFDE